MMKNTRKSHLELKCQDIDKAADSGSSFLKSHGFSDDAVQAPIMVLRELIKKSMKYGMFKIAADGIAVRLQIDKNMYTIEVLNPVDNTCDHRLKELDKTIQFIRGYQDPYEAYSRKLAEAENHPSNADAFDPGFMKIAYEVGAILDFYVSEDNLLNLSAVGSLDGDSRI